MEGATVFGERTTMSFHRLPRGLALFQLALFLCLGVISRPASEEFPRWAWTASAILGALLAGMAFCMFRKCQKVIETLACESRLDHLTGLPNRRALMETLAHAAASTRATDSAGAVIFLDLDRFKLVNDEFGYGCGDAMLQAVGPRIREAVRDIDKSARFGGDEFVVLLPGADEGVARSVAKRLLDAFSQPIQVANQSLIVGCTLGIALYPQHGDARTVLEQAAAALQWAKRNGVRCVMAPSP